MVKHTSLFSRVFPRAYRVRFLVPVLLLADAALAAASDTGYDSLEFTSNVMSHSALRQAGDDHTKLPYTSKTVVSTLDGGSDATTDPAPGPEVDSDADGVYDSEDNCPFDFNPDQANSDGDTLGDVCDEEIDSDGDGVYDSEDNCPFDFNPEQTNLDGDALGDVCDEDLDGDGVDDIEDVFPDNPDEAFDTDNDGIGNNADTDDDNDGLLDLEESQLGTDPLSRDSDGDGWTDLEEVEEGSDPLSRESEPELATGLPIWLLYVATQGNADPPSDSQPLGDVIEGTFTRSSASNASMCWFSNYDGAFSGAEFYASAPPALFDGGLACGDVYEVSCKEGSEANAGAQGGCLDGTDKIKVVINDYCPDCPDTQILTTDFGFYELGGSNPPDSLDAKFQRVEGDYEGNITAVMHPDSSEWWSAVILVGSNLRIVELEFADSSETSFRQATFAGPGWYLEPIELSRIILPISLRVTAEDGSQLTFNDVITSFSGSFDTGANF